MIPIIVGAVVAGVAGAAIFSGDDKSDKPNTEKRQVSKEYAMKYLQSAGKTISQNSQQPSIEE